MAMTRALLFVVVLVVVVCQMSFDDTDNDFNDMVIVILMPRSLTAAAPQYPKVKNSII